MVKFAEISEDDFQQWEKQAITDYFADRVRAGNDISNSSDNARAEFVSLLPYGKLTRNHYIYSIVDEKDSDRKVGVIWYAVNTQGLPNDTLFIYDILVYEEQRGKGYGTAVLRLLEDRAKALGKKKIALHVFAHNERARKLYQSLGYRPTNIMMAKEL